MAARMASFDHTWAGFDGFHAWDKSVTVDPEMEYTDQPVLENHCKHPVKITDDMVKYYPKRKEALYQVVCSVCLDGESK